MTQRWCDPDIIYIRTWCVYEPAAYEGQPMTERPCLLVMRSTEAEVVEVIGVERSYDLEWDWDREHGYQRMERKERARA